MNQFYVSDSFTLAFGAGATLHLPGPFNSSKTYGPSSEVIVEWEAGNLGFVVYQDSLQGANLDVMAALYEISTGVAIPVDSGNPLPFLPPYGGAPNGVLMNAVCRFGQHSGTAGYRLSRPVRVGRTTPADPGKSYQVGARFVVNAGVAGTLAYQYFMQGTMPDSAPTTPPTTTMKIVVGGVTYTWPVTPA